MELFQNNGQVRPLGQRLKECADKYGMTIVEGVGPVVGHAGYKYAFPQ